MYFCLARSHSLPPQTSSLLASIHNDADCGFFGGCEPRRSRDHREARKIAKHVLPSQYPSIPLSECSPSLVPISCDLLLTSVKIGGLRSLLPEKLINPARVALDNPGQYEPEKLATYLQTAAKAGSRDVETFKKDWHSDDVRALLHNVNAKGLPQGGDAWPLDYGGFLQDVATNDQTPTTPNGASHEFQPPTNAELVKAVDDFRARHPELDIHVSDGATLLPIDIQVAHFDLRVERASNGGTGYIVIDKPGRAASGLRHDILQSISESKERAHLATVLVRLAPPL